MNESLWGTGMIGASGLLLVVFGMNFFMMKKNGGTDLLKNLPFIRKLLMMVNPQDRIESIKQEQVRISADIKKLEDTSVEKQKIIRKIVDRAAKDANDVLKETNLEKIQERIDSSWDEI